MNKVLYIANWKSNKTMEEAIQFFDQFKNEIATVDTSNKHIIISPPFTLLPACKKYIADNNLNVSLAAQNVSAFPQGAYTGEINARQIKEFVDYVIIGHSERRKYLHEDESDIANKIRETMEMGIKVIQCIQDEDSVIHRGAEIIAYEPPSAIGSGNPDDPNHVAEVFNSIRQHDPDVVLLYGGSINPETISQYKEIDDLRGFLIGGASLDASSFISLLS